MKWDFKIVVLLVEWSSFRGGLKAGFYCISLIQNVMVKKTLGFKRKIWMVNKMISIDCVRSVNTK